MLAPGLDQHEAAVNDAVLATSDAAGLWVWTKLKSLATVWRRGRE